MIGSANKKEYNKIKTFKTQLALPNAHSSMAQPIATLFKSPVGIHSKPTKLTYLHNTWILTPSRDGKYSEQVRRWHQLKDRS